MASPEAAPHPVQAHAAEDPNGYANPTGKPYAPLQKAWLRYVEKLESGEATDPTGQYVSKKQHVERAEDGSAPARPKEGAESKKGDFGFDAYVRANGGYDGPACPECLVGGKLIYVYPNEDPDNPTGGGTGGGPAITSTFQSSEGQGGTGNILDLKITKGGSSSISPLPGYNKIAVDLNRGAGGRYIYITFTRQAGSIQLGNETNWGWAASQTSGPVRAVQVFGAATGISLGWVFGNTPPRGFVPTWAPNPIPGVDWKEPDYNDGAGGAYLYGYQFKDIALAPNAPVEVGVIASNTRYPVPPAGWTADYTQDLNERAGGDFIYYCYK